MIWEARVHRVHNTCVCDALSNMFVVYLHQVGIWIKFHDCAIKLNRIHILYLWRIDWAHLRNVCNVHGLCVFGLTTIKMLARLFSEWNCREFRRMHWEWQREKKMSGGGEICVVGWNITVTASGFHCFEELSQQLFDCSRDKCRIEFPTHAWQQQIFLWVFFDISSYDRFRSISFAQLSLGENMRRSMAESWDLPTNIANTIQLIFFSYICRFSFFFIHISNLRSKFLQSKKEKSSFLSAMTFCIAKELEIYKYIYYVYTDRKINIEPSFIMTRFNWC